VKKVPVERITKGNVGENLFEAIISPHAIPHKIEGSKDVGVDYFCEWINNNEPTGIVFVAQVKFYPAAKANFIGTDNRLNLLDKYRITPSISIDEDTQEYWNLLGMPCYLFVYISNEKSGDLFYKRYTPIVNGKASQSESDFFKVNDELKFHAFTDTVKHIGGFARDLYIDQMRSNYNKGLIAYLNPRRLGLQQFPDADTDIYFRDIFQKYKANFENTFRQLGSVFGTNGELQATPSEAAPDDEANAG
jgi:hypothetical protein